MDKQVVIIGAGRSGRGMLGELYNRSGYHIVFADKDQTLLKQLDEQKYYTVKMTNLVTNDSEEQKVTGFTSVNVADKKTYYQILNDADIISTAILPCDFDEVIEDLVGAIKMRFQQRWNEKPMIITLGANYVGMKRYFSERIEMILEKAEREWFAQHVVLLTSIVNRKNLLPGPEDRTEDVLRVVGDDKAILQVEKHPVLESFEKLPDWMIQKDDLEAAMAVKIWSGNLVQGSMVAVGMYKGFTDTFSCAMDLEASKWAYYAALEGYEAVRREFGLPERSETDAKNTVKVFRNPCFKDNCYRIIRNPIRKLARNERFIGPALCALRQKILPFYILKCCAYMFYYNDETDQESVRMQKEIQEWGIDYVIEKYCQLNIQETEEALIASMLKNFYLEIKESNLLDS